MGHLVNDLENLFPLLNPYSTRLILNIGVTIQTFIKKHARTESAGACFAR